MHMQRALARLPQAVDRELNQPRDLASSVGSAGSVALS